MSVVFFVFSAFRAETIATELLYFAAVWHITRTPEFFGAISRVLTDLEPSPNH